MNKQRIFLSPPHMSGREQKYIQQAFATNWIAPIGFNVDSFEKEICEYIGAKEAVAVSSGTAAIHLALSLLGVKKGDVVFCSTLTFIASANPILYQGAEPVFIDSEPETWNMSPEALKRALKEASYVGKLPKAVIIVNLYGQSAKWDEILSICNHYEIPVVEDAAESLGSTYKGKATGIFGKYGIFSFNGNKIITTSGGGMLVSNDISSLQKARFLASQAKDPAPYYHHSIVGFNYRMSNVLAGIGRGQLEMIEDRVKSRRKIFETYKKHLVNIPGICFMPELENTKSNRWLTAITINEKETGVSVESLIQNLEEENIEARHIWKPLHLQPIFKGLKYYPHYKNGSISEQIFTTGICLPSGSNMSNEVQMRVIKTIQSKFIREGRDVHETNKIM